MDDIKEVGKYLKQTARKADLALKRDFEPQTTVEKIRDIFDTVQPFEAAVETPVNMSKAIMDITFRQKLPALACCGDCYCGATEAYTSDSLIDDNIYVTTEYVPNSTTVYLDGALATRGVEYQESNPGAKQLEIYIPFSTIVISYVYTIGNCSEDICIDTWPCPEYTILSGLATVFADRFDRGPIDEIPYGGCGFWSTNSNGSIVDTPVIDGFKGYADNLFAHFGAEVVGRSVEVAAAVDAETAHLNLTMTGFSNSIVLNIQFNADDTYNYLLEGNARYRTIETPSSPLVHDTTEVVFNRTQSGLAGPAGFYSSPKFVSAAQLPTGELVLKAWIQGAPSTSGITQTLTIADWSGPTLDGDDELVGSPELIPIAVRTVRITSVFGWVQTLKIGSGLDPGEVEVAGTDVRSANFNTCKNPPPLYSGYFGACNPESYSTSSGGSSFPSFSATIAFPVQVGVPEEDLAGTGRLIDVSHHMGVVPARGGSAVIIRGAVRTFFALTSEPYSVIFQSFNQDIPSYNNQNFTGNQISSMTVPSNDGYLPFEIQVPVFDDLARWSVHIPNLSPYAESLDYIGGGFLSPPNHGIGVALTDLEFEIVPEPNCTAREICGDCIDQVCPQITDAFYSDTISSFSTPSSVDVERVTESGSPMIIEQGDGTRLDSIGSGIGQVTWLGANVDSYSAMWFTYPTSVFDCRISLEQDMFASFEFKVNTLSPISGYADVLWGGFVNGIQAFISFGGGAVIDSEFGNQSLPVSLSAGVWMTAEYQTDGADILGRVYPSGTTPSSWVRISGAVDVDGTNSPSPYFFAVGYDQIDTASNYSAEIKNVIIRRVV